MAGFVPPNHHIVVTSELIAGADGTQNTLEGETRIKIGEKKKVGITAYPSQLGGSYTLKYLVGLVRQ